MWSAQTTSCSTSCRTSSPTAPRSFRLQLHLHPLPSQIHHASSMSSSSLKSPVQVPRFQRRTSERAYFEGAFKPGGMDYSTLPNDADHPEGSSPWASSPKQSRDFGARPADLSSGTAPPQSPFGASAQEASNYSERPSTSDSATLARSETDEGPQSPYNREPAGQSQQGQPYGQQGPPHQHSGEQARPQQAARYHARPAQQQQQAQAQRPQPQYKLQCKITALERTGKKDPIFRFDAYVSKVACLVSTKPLILEDKSAKVPYNAVQRHSAHAS